MQEKQKQYSVDPFEIVELFSRFINPETAYKEVLRFITEAFDADCGRIIMKDADSGTFTVQAVSMRFPKLHREFSSSIINTVIERKKAICIHNAVVDPQYNKSDSVSGKTFLSVISVPILDEEEPIGAIYLDRHDINKGEFNGEYHLGNIQLLAQKLLPILLMQQRLDQMNLDRTKLILKDLGIIAGDSKVMKSVYQKVQKYARSDLNLFIHGETGVGKEWLTRAVHRLSKRRHQPFVVVDCTQLTNETAEAELFGSVPGAFTGAVNKAGYFERADGGSIFLDEIGDLPIEVQGRLLRVLEKGNDNAMTFTRKGGNKNIMVNVRVISVTNRNLDDLVAQKSFREDLYFRLQQLQLHVPSLQERNEDIIPLALGFLDRIYLNNMGLSKDAQEALCEHTWQGNVRELKNCIERAIVEYGGEAPLTANMLFPDKTTKTVVTDPLIDSLNIENYKCNRHHLVLTTVKKCRSKAEAARRLGIHRTSVYNILNTVDCETVNKVLKHHQGNQNLAAQELEISVKTLSKILTSNRNK